MDIKKINKMMQNGTLMSDYNIAHDIDKAIDKNNLKLV